MPIDRRALVERANVVVTSVDPRSALTVGNGQTAFTADVTGLQTLNSTYVSPPLQMQTHADFGWHTTPPPTGVNPLRFKETAVVARNHSALYPITQTGQAAEWAWLRANPHRLSLLRLFLRRSSGVPIAAADLQSIHQTLHLWNGTLISSFVLDGDSVSVTTAFHPSRDAVGVRVCSAAVRSKALGLGLAFPYGSEGFKGKGGWTSDYRHSSTLVSGGGPCDARPVVRHTLDATTYHVHLDLAGGGCPSLSAGRVAHDWSIFRAVDSDSSCLEASLWLAPTRQAVPPPSATEVISAAAAHWPREWSRGAALELAQSRAKGAAALEARVTRSQWIAMSQEAGDLPPQETGLMMNSWYGKFHTEMRWMHQAHHLLWGRPDLAQRSEGYFERVRGAAERHTRVAQHYRGVRWPKMAGPPQRMPLIGDSADPNGAPLFDGPSGAGPLIVWEQPHPILFAELHYRAEPTNATLARYNRTVHDTADFMADFVLAPSPPADPAACLPLGPPLWTAEVESNDAKAASDATSSNPTFELVYWRFGLSLAAQWRVRLGLPPVAAWEAVLARLCTPTARPLGSGAAARAAGEDAEGAEGASGGAAAGAEAPSANVYYPYESGPCPLISNGVAPQIFAASIAPGERFGADAATLRRTLAATLPTLLHNLPWGSDAAMYAMAAARLGNASLAASILADPDSLWTDKFMPNGHYGNAFLPVYTPANGALLTAVAFLAGGWDGDGGEEAPGFPKDGSWTVRAEGFRKYF